MLLARHLECVEGSLGFRIVTFDNAYIEATTLSLVNFKNLEAGLFRIRGKRSGKRKFHVVGLFVSEVKILI